MRRLDGLLDIFGIARSRPRKCGLVYILVDGSGGFKQSVGIDTDLSVVFIFCKQYEIFNCCERIVVWFLERVLDTIDSADRALVLSKLQNDFLAAIQILYRL